MEIIQKKISSTNYGGVNKGRRFVIVHANGGTANSTLNWFNNPDANVSYHYLVTLAGEVWQFVDENDRAWHAGVSSWDGFSNLNDWSVGVCVESLEGRDSQLTEPQYNALLELITDIQARHNIKTSFVRGHKEVSPDRKTDPVHINMDTLRHDLDKADAIKTIVVHNVRHFEIEGNKLIIRGEFVKTERKDKIDLRQT